MSRAKARVIRDALWAARPLAHVSANKQHVSRARNMFATKLAGAAYGVARGATLIPSLAYTVTLSGHVLATQAGVTHETGRERRTGTGSLSSEAHAATSAHRCSGSGPLGRHGFRTGAGAGAQQPQAPPRLGIACVNPMLCRNVLTQCRLTTEMNDHRAACST